MSEANRISRKERLLLIALLITYFPCGILFPLAYPAREIVTLVLWVLAIPSLLGWASLALLPAIPNETYGYFAFNLFCVLGTLGVGLNSARMRFAEVKWERIYRFSRWCMAVSVLIAIWQGFDGDSWMEAFPAMSSLGAGRGGGFRPEPSLLAPLLAVHLALVTLLLSAEREDSSIRRRLRIDAVVVVLAAILFTKSISVVIVAGCFVPAFGARLKHILLSGLACAIIAIPLIGSRIDEAIRSGGDLGWMITSALNSWRNVPDILILMNPGSYLFPSNPAEMRTTINSLATMWSPALAWLANTYSTFSAMASTAGLVLTVGVASMGFAIGIKTVGSRGGVRLTWMLIFISNWFILPKYEAAGWVALGLLTLSASQPASVPCVMLSEPSLA